jgi:two-component system, NtrC family, sensor kinase
VLGVKPQAPASDEWAIESAERQEGLLTFACAVGCFLPADILLVHRLDPVLLAARLGWSLLLVVGAAVTRPLGPQRTGLVDVLLILGSNLFCVWLVVLTGGAHSAYLPWFLVMPLALTPFTLADRRATTLGWAICTVASFWLLKAHLDARGLMVWGFLMAGSGFVGLYGTAFRSRLSKKLISIQESRERMAVQLADVERQRGYAERLALVGQLAAGVAHEINNPLAFVHANLSFVRLEAERLPEAARAEVVEALHEAERGVERIKSIIRDLRVFARKDREAPELCYLGDVVADAVVLARASALVPLQCVTAPGLPPVRAVARHLSEVVLNLLVNAADALERLPPDAERSVRLHVYEEGAQVCVSVEDTGVGFPVELRERVFEPFFTTKPVGKGTGLGLALAREYVERYGGQLLAESRPEGGARFTMRLPRVEGAAPADAPWEQEPVGDPDVTPVPRKRSGPRASA